MRIALYMGPGSGRRSRYIAEAMRLGLLEHGIKSELRNRFNGVRGDVAIAYGWVHAEVFSAYRAAGAQFGYFDLGYWNRRPSNSPLDGHYRLAVNDWDTAAHMQRGCPADRFDALGIEVLPPRLDGREIVIASMSVKSAKVHGFELGEWEQSMQGRLAAMKLNHPVIVRKKPGKKVAPMPPIGAVLRTARVLVTRHSNAAVDAMVHGVPFYAEHGVGALLSPNELTRDFIDRPTFCSEADRKQLLADIAYAQWTPEEMRTGEAWEYMKVLLCA